MYEEYQVRVYEECVKWYQNGKLHREGSPAVEYADGEKQWYQNGELHRLDGPAIEYVSGIKSWYIEGVRYTEEDYHKKIAEMNAPTCVGKEVEIDGKTYILTLKE